MALDTVPMDFSYGGSFRTRSNRAFERLLHDAMAGDQTLFLRKGAVERSWEIVAPVLNDTGTVHPYAAGTWGPAAADELIAPRAWRTSYSFGSSEVVHAGLVPGPRDRTAYVLSERWRERKPNEGRRADLTASLGDADRADHTPAPALNAAASLNNVPRNYS